MVVICRARKTGASMKLLESSRYSRNVSVVCVFITSICDLRIALKQSESSI